VDIRVKLLCIREWAGLGEGDGICNFTLDYRVDARLGVWFEFGSNQANLIVFNPRTELVLRPITGVVVFTRTDVLLPSISPALDKFGTASGANARVGFRSSLPDRQHVRVWNMASGNTERLDALAKALRRPSLGNRRMDGVAVVFTHEHNRQLA